MSTKLHAPRPAVAAVAERLACDPDAGKLYWRVRPEGDFASAAACRAFNSRYAGTEAMTAHKQNGAAHGQITLDGERYWLSRGHVIWALATGEWPTLLIGHRNGISSDDRLANLRLQTDSEQSAASRDRTTTKSGHRGVGRRRGKFEARIKAHGVLHILGRFERLEDAITARMNAALSLFPEHARVCHHHDTSVSVQPPTTTGSAK